MAAIAFIPRAPAALRLGLWPVPTTVIELVLARVVRSIARRHPEIAARMGPHVGKSFLLEPIDLPYLVLLAIRRNRPAVTVVRSRDGLRTDATITGSIAALVGLVHGRYDGDALFFSGDLMIEGDMEAVLALRNAIDNAEIDLLQEGASMFGPLSSGIEHAVRLAAPLVERHTGLALTRSGTANR